MSDLGVGPLHLYPKPWEEVMEHGTPSALEVEFRTTKEPCSQVTEVYCKTGMMWLSSGNRLLQVWGSHGTILRQSNGVRFWNLPEECKTVAFRVA